MVISMLAKDLASQGRDIVDMSLGEPDFDTPTHIIEAAYKAMREGHTRYTPPQGTLALRQAIVRKFQRENDLHYSVDEITVGNGAKQVIFNTFMATLEEGDEVIIPAPYWVSYSDIVTLNGGTARVIPCGLEVGFKLSAEAFEAAITDKTRWLVLNSPSNPSGAIYTASELQALGRVLEKHPNILVMSDEIYEHVLLADQPFVSFATACPQLRERTLLINGVAKAYAMTGWRIGFATGPRWMLQAMEKLQGQQTSGASSVSQQAALAALQGPKDFIQHTRAVFQRRRDVMVALLNATPGLECVSPAGAFYAFVSCAGLIGRTSAAGRVLHTDTDVAHALLDEANVAVVPGSAFGLAPYIRIAYALDDASLRKACEAIRRFCTSCVTLDG